MYYLILFASYLCEENKWISRLEELIQSDATVLYRLKIEVRDWSEWII